MKALSSMRMSHCLFLLLLALLVLTSCSNGAETAPSDGTERLRVVATTVQIDALAREVGGENIDLAGLIPAGGDPHTFEPKASDLASIEDAAVILRHGIGLDDWLDDTLAAGSDAAVVTVTDSIALFEGEVGADETEGDRTNDAHVWHDPDNAQLMVDAIAAALAAADPTHSTVYQKNAEAYNAKLDRTGTEVQSIIDEILPDDRKMVTDHDAFGYFARAFGLEIVGAIIPSTSSEAEPSAEDMAALLETIEREGVKAIFAEESANPQLATTLAEDAGVAIVDDLYGDSLGKPGSGAETVDGMLLANARKIADALT